MQPNNDAMILRQLYLERYGYGFASKLSRPMKRSDRKIVTLVRNFFADASPKEMTALLKMNRRNLAVRYFLDELYGIIEKQSVKSVEKALKELDKFAVSTIDHTYTAMGSQAQDKPSSRSILALPVVGLALARAWQNLHSKYSADIAKTLITAIQMDSDPIDLIRGTKSAKFRDGLINKKNNNVRSLASTQVYGVASASRSASFNRLGVKYEVITATLDFRTSSYCRSVDGDIWPIGEGAQPPFHWWCRTLRLPWSGENEERPYVKDGRVVAKIPKSERGSKIGTTTDTYQQFFDRLTGSQQEEILGRERYKRYKSGQVDSMKDFVHPQTGRKYTLKELDSLFA